MGGSVAECDHLVWFLGDDRFGTAGYCHSCSAISRGYRRNVLKGTAPVAGRRTDRRVLPQWQCDIERMPPERPGQLIPKKAQKLRASRTPRASSRDSHAKH